MSTHRLLRDLAVTVIPAGEPAVLAAGSEVHIVQTLGGNVTLRTDGGLFRVAAEDVSAIEGYHPGEAEEGGPTEFSEAAVWDALKSCYDPEIPLNIVDLGLVYDLSIEPTGNGGNQVDVKMTLTAPGCGMGPVIAEDARRKIAGLPSVENAKVHIVWEPQWSPHMISQEGRKVLGLE